MKYKIGLGIDAGGTFTDAVLFDFKKKKVLFKAKSLTTRWNYSEGIKAAIAGLPRDELDRTDIVSLSTTLVTNAVVEGRIHPVGLLLMPSADFKMNDFDHTPTGVIRGRMSIDGFVTEPVNAEEVVSVITKMVSVNKVQAFAVSGYGSAINPKLELEVKEIIRKETGLYTCCGHELSGTLNFLVRANTAVLNAGTIPVMEEFLAQMKSALNDAGIVVPAMVVRGDGTVASFQYARDFPIQTVLSGPAASMAGARFLTGAEDAVVIDVGGTTTDIGFLENGRVSVCEEGSVIGSWKTHVQAVDMLTAGLGGDSEILFDRNKWSAGPKRITPFCFMTTRFDKDDLLKTVKENGDSWGSTKVFQWLYLSGKESDFPLSGQEQKILGALKKGPVTVSALSEEIGAGHWKFVRSGRLEERGIVIRAGLTPTDLFHAEGKLDIWNRTASSEYLRLIAGKCGTDPGNLISELNKLMSDSVGTALFSRIFPGLTDSTAFVKQIINKGNRHLAFKLTLLNPVIGLGAAAELMLSDIVQRLGGKLVLPEYGDVANAVGAVTSKVSVSLSASVVPAEKDGYRIIGMKCGMCEYATLEEADSACRRELEKNITALARIAGTSENNITMEVNTRTSIAAGGKEIFLERSFVCTLTGMPDMMS